MKPRFCHRTSLLVFLLIPFFGFALMSCTSESPSSPMGYHLNSTWGTSQERWAVGDNGIFLHYVKSVGEWAPSTQSTILTKDKLAHVWGLSEKDVWAVGGNLDANTGFSTGSVFHYDGTQWTLMYHDESQFGISYLYGIWGSSSNDIWAVGAKGYMVHYDGNKWIKTDSGSKNDLLAIWGSGSQDIWVGTKSDMHVLLHFDGTSWQSAFGAEVNVSTIWGSGANDVWAVGNGSVIIHFDGIGWKAISLGDLVPKYHTLQGIWGSSKTDVWAAGDNVVLHYNGTQWSLQDGQRGFTGIWGASATEVWGVGAGVWNLDTHTGSPQWVQVQAKKPIF